jgi:hypothetical protein
LSEAGDVDALHRDGKTAPMWAAYLFHRLNRTEYVNVARELLAIEVDAATILPPEVANSGFDNIAGALKASPALMERYHPAA